MPPPHGPDESDAIRVPTSAVLSLGLRVFRRLYARCRDIAHDEVVAYLREMIRGDRFMWQHQLPGHGYELTQHGTYTFASGEIHVGVDVSDVHPIIYSTDAITDYATGQVPDVQATPQTSGWIAYAKPTSGAEETSLDLWVERNAAGASARQTGYHTATVWNGNNVSGLTSGTPGTAETVTYATAFDSAPSLMAHVETVSGGVPTGIWAADYIPVIQSQSASGFTFVLDYRPEQGTNWHTVLASTGIPDADTMLGILGASVQADATTDPTTTGGAGLTGGVHDPGSGVLTGLQDTDHHHTTGIPNANYTTGTHNLDSGIQSATHAHGLSSPGSDHHHPVGPHTHLVDDHHHTINDPQHQHNYTLPTPIVGSDQTRALIFTAIGPLATAAGLPTVSWQATAIQAS